LLEWRASFLSLFQLLCAGFLFLNDLLACDKAVTAEPLSREVPEELADIFAIYMKGEPAPEKLSRLQHLLGISNSAAVAIREC